MGTVSIALCIISSAVFMYRKCKLNVEYLDELKYYATAQKHFSFISIVFAFHSY